MLRGAKVHANHCTMQHDKLKTISLVAQKGGTGKTTLAVNLAALAASEGLRVALVDCDPQQSAAAWWKTRQAEDVELITGGVSDLAKIQTALNANGFDLLFVDTRPSVENETTIAIQCATVALIPTRPSILDLRAVASTAGLIKAASGTGCIVLNQCPPPRGIGEGALTKEAKTVASSLGVPVAPPVVAMRAAFSYSLNDGRAAFEYEPDKAADLETRALWRYIRKAYLNG